MTGLLIFAVGIWRSTHFTLQSVIMRQEHIKNSYALAALLSYGIAYAQLNSNELLACKKEVVVTFDTWPAHAPAHYKTYCPAQLMLRSKKDSISIAGYLTQMDPPLKIQGSCIMNISVDNGHRTFSTHSWQ